MLARFFIDRPIFAAVISILITLGGGIAALRLPLSQFPPVTPPTIQVDCNYPGASAEVVSKTIAAPLEQRVNGVERMLYMSSQCTNDGSYTLTITFEPGTDLNLAQVLVQNRVNLAIPELPEVVRSTGVTVRKRSPELLLTFALMSKSGRYDQVYLSNYAVLHLRETLSRIRGISDVTIFGQRDYSLRIWIQPGQLEARQLTVLDVVSAIKAQNAEVALGNVNPEPREFTITSLGRLNSVEQFEDIIVKTGPDGQLVHLRDVARVELSARSNDITNRFDRQQTVGLAIFLTPDANAITTSAELKATMDKLSEDFPPGMEHEIGYDTTPYIESSIFKVFEALRDSIILVAIVVLVFLQSWRSALIPLATVPVAIIGTCGVMAIVGYGLNNLTLFGLVLAVGIVVDDAIVVVEGAAHNIEKGMSGHDAAIAAMDALFAPIVGITLVLISVFLPAAFLPGLTGKMYSQFALVIAATALLSAVNAATLKPTQCALWLRRPVPPEQRNWFYRGFNAVYDRVERGYARLIGRLVAHSGVSVMAALILIGVAGWGLSRVPTGFIPIEDQGYLLVAVQLPDGASLDRTQNVMKQVSDLAGKTPGVDQVISISGISALDNSSSLANAGVAYLILKEWSARGPGQDLRSLFVGLNEKMSAIQEARILVVPPPPIQGIGNAAGFAMQVQLRDGNADYGKLQAIAGAIVANGQSQSALQRVSSSFRSMVPQFDVEVDRVKTQTLHVTTDQIFSTLSSYMGSSFVNQFNKFGRTFQVYAQADAQFRLTPRDIEKLMVRNSQGDMIPLGTVAKITPAVGPSLISLYNLYPSATVIGLPATGYSSGQSMALMEEIAAKTLPPGTGYEWTAMSYQEKVVGGQIYWAFGLALLLVYLVLAGQYESWYAPISVILAVPLSLLGPMAVLTGLRIENNLYTQIGIILLIALSAKNAILIVEVALELHVRDRKPLIESAVEAARARFRPIVMTSFAFILGVVPLVLATGAGASARKSIGITVFSGMIASTCLAVLFVPTFFVVVQRFENWLAGRKSEAPAPQAVPVVTH